MIDSENTIYEIAQFIKFHHSKYARRNLFVFFMKEQFSFGQMSFSSELSLSRSNIMALSFLLKIEIIPPTSQKTVPIPLLGARLISLFLPQDHSKNFTVSTAACSPVIPCSVHLWESSKKCHSVCRWTTLNAPSKLSHNCACGSLWGNAAPISWMTFSYTTNHLKSKLLYNACRFTDRAHFQNQIN